MQINNLSSLFSQVKEEDMWESISDQTPELYLEKGGEYTIRIIGPVYKVRRCYVNRDNAIARNLTVQDFKKVIKGSAVNVKPSQYPKASIEEMETASTRARWGKGLVTTAILLSNNKGAKNNRLYYISIPSSGVISILEQCSKKKNVCLSGVKANDITLTKARNGGFATSARVSRKDSFLNKKSMDHILSEGLRDAKEFYIDLNQKNLSKKSGFFYSFIDKDASSVLDKHFEPVNQIRNYIEEDQQHDHIQEDMVLYKEHEGVLLIDFVDIE